MGCSQYDNQLVALILDSLDDMESSIRELALSAVLEMLKNQVCISVLGVEYVFFGSGNRQSE